MYKKVLRKNKKSRFFLFHNKRGKIGLGVMLLILVVISLSFVLVFNNTGLSKKKAEVATQYLCCDSGNGNDCLPKQDVTLNVNLDGINNLRLGSQTYGLLKTGIKLSDGDIHLAPITDKSRVQGLQPGQHLYYNTVDARWNAPGYNYSGFCEVQGKPTNPMDAIFIVKLGPNLDECAGIPNDELVYVCTQGCDDNGNPRLSAFDGVFNAYFRTKDLNDNPGVPDSIKNCVQPQESAIKKGKQQLINLPRPSSKPNLQLETFDVTQSEVTSDWVSPYCKPAVYLYPEEKSEVHVSLKPVGRLTYTIPRYPESGWEVTAYPDGSINEGGNWYDYLYYEAEIPDKEIRLPEEGYVISYGELRRFLPELVKGLGLNERETKEFSGYWLKVLPEARYYEIKVVSEGELGRISPLDILPRPDTSIRVTIHFEARDSWKEIGAPRVDTPRREGFTVVEWGGIFKRDAKHPFSCLM